MRIGDLASILRDFGPGWVIRRLWYAAQRRAGMLRRRMPAADWGALNLENLASTDFAKTDHDAYLSYRRNAAPRFFFDDAFSCFSRLQFDVWDAGGNAAKDDANAILSGRFRYFGWREEQLGFPPDWVCNAFTGVRIPDDAHWSEIGEFSAGDVKIVWEPNRFGFTYSLVRAYARTGDERYAEAFWKLVEDWRAHNRPNRGPNWMCGQEASIRLFAWCFGLYGFRRAGATTAARVRMLAEMVAFTGERVEANIDYAIAQQNNHGISEALGLFTIGILFPELRHSARWGERGARLLETLVQELVYEDGAFSQHSMNYHRMVVQELVWAIRLGALNGQRFSEGFIDRARRAARFLFEVSDPASGRVPNYGANDGALVFPLSNCEFADYRPSIQAALRLLDSKSSFDAGAWDEESAWFLGSSNAATGATERTPETWRAPMGGYHVLRSGSGFLFTRAARFRHRPGQADLLHVDVWWRGENVALDPGTYSYNAPSPWDNSLISTRFHNAVTVDGHDQMERVSRFMLVPWIEGRVVRTASTGLIHYWEGSHDGFRRLGVSYRRAIVQLPLDHWLVLDSVESNGVHDARVQWLLGATTHEHAAGRVELQLLAGAYSVSLACSRDFRSSVVTGDRNSPRGWRSGEYQRVTPALSLDGVARGRDVVFATLLGPGRGGLDFEGRQISVHVESMRVNVLLARKGPVVSRVEVFDSLSSLAESLDLEAR